MTQVAPDAGYIFESLDGGGVTGSGQQKLAQEAAVAISYNGLNHGVMMATPHELEDFARGYSLTAGIITHGHQILDIEARYGTDSVCLDITLHQRAFHHYKLANARLRRRDAGSSACGLCGIEALGQALTPPISADVRSRIYRLPPPEHLQNLRSRFNALQRSREASGAMHAAMVVDSEGRALACREDIGRHNALDKLIGACARQQIPLDCGFVAISSRCGLELVQKALRAGIGNLVSLSSPSGIAVRWARQYQLNLIHVPASAEPRVYSASCARHSQAVSQVKIGEGYTP